MDKHLEINMDPLQKQMLDDVFDAFTMISGGALVTLMHVEGGFTRYTPAAVELFELPGEYIPNGADEWTSRVHPEDRKRYLDVMIPLANGETFTYDVTYRVRVSTGGYSAFRAVGATLRNAEGKPSLIGGVLINEGLAQNTDPITILRNREGFLDDVNSLIRAGREANILMLGISGLSQINDVYGYGYGNRVLQELGWTIQQSIAGNGGVYRMEGSSFGVITETLTREQLTEIYGKVRRQLQRGIRVENERLNLSLNGSMMTAGGVQTDARTVYSCINYVYRESKERKHGELVPYEGGAGYDAKDYLRLLDAVRDSIVDGCADFSMKYQPIIDAKTERIVGAEALVRWHKEPYGEVMPMNYIPMLEHDYVFEELTSWILRTAIRDGRSFVEKDPDLILGINISPVQLEDDFFVGSLLKLLSANGLPAKNLGLELSDGCRMLDVEFTKRSVETLRAEGVRFVVDDFGSGFGSLDFIRAIDADFVKLDQRFVKGIEEREEDRLTLKGLAELAMIHGAEVGVKGVETAEMRDIIRQYPVSTMQGYFYAKPMDAGEMRESIQG